jgi:hypothetical protein
MNINMNAWHYRLLKHTETDAPNGLCWYPWKVLWAFVQLTGIGLFLSILGWVLASGTGLLLWHLFTWTPLGDLGSQPIDVTVLVVIIMWGGITLALLIGIPMMIWEEYQQNKRLQVYIARHAGIYVEPIPSPFVAYVSAQHDKICPMLTYVSGEKK